MNHKRLRRKVTVLVPWWCFVACSFSYVVVSLSSVMVLPTIQGQTKFVQDLENDNLVWRRPNALKK